MARHYDPDDEEAKPMNNDTIAGNWKQLKGKIQARGAT